MTERVAYKGDIYSSGQDIYMIIQVDVNMYSRVWIDGDPNTEIVGCIRGTEGTPTKCMIDPESDKLLGNIVDIGNLYLQLIRGEL